MPDVRSVGPAFSQPHTTARPRQTGVRNDVDDMRDGGVLFALGVVVVPYLTRTLKFTSMIRYILLAFPVFIVMAKLCTDRLWLALCITGRYWVG